MRHRHLFRTYHPSYELVYPEQSGQLEVTVVNVSSEQRSGGGSTTERYDCLGIMGKVAKDCHTMSILS